MVAVAASSKENVASQARGLLGVGPINTFDEDLSGIAALTYERIVLGVLSGPYKWRFATTKLQLSRSTTDPINEWKYAYALPSDQVANPDAVFDSAAQGAAPNPRFEVFGKNLYTDEELVFIDYRVRPVESDWPAYFTQLIIYACASEWAEALTDDEEKAAYWGRVAFGPPEEAGQGGYSRTARTADARGGGIQAVQNFDLIAARMGAA